METLLKIRCKNCNIELVSHFSQTKCCGCDNMTTISNQKISAIDLSLVQIVSHIKTNKKIHISQMKIFNGNKLEKIVK